MITALFFHNKIAFYTLLLEIITSLLQRRYERLKELSSFAQSHVAGKVSFSLKSRALADHLLPPEG